MNLLKSGDEAPDFRATTFDGKPFHLADLAGIKTWLCFYRYANCPLCHQHLFEITQHYEQLALGKIQLVAVFESQRLRFGKLQDRRFPTFPMISDPDGELYEVYNVPVSASAIVQPSVAKKFLQAMFNGFFQGAIDGPMGRVPAHFLIHEDLTIHTAHYGESIADHISWDTVKSFLTAPVKPMKRKARG